VKADNLATSRPRVLLVDDNTAYRERLTRALQSSDYSTWQADSRSDGLHKMYEVRPDLILLSVGADLVECERFIEQIRQVTDIPVLLLVPGSRPNGVGGGKTSEITGVLSKSVPLDLTLGRIAKELRRYSEAKAQTAVTLDDFDEGYVHRLVLSTSLSPSQVRQITRAMEKIDNGEIWLVKREGSLDRIIAVTSGKVKTYPASD
jgi:DNA-binding response OmpR family regulator